MRLAKIQLRGWTAGVVMAVIMAAGITVARQQEASVSDGWIKLPAAGATSTVAFVQVTNPTMYDVYLVSASTDVADTVEFRRTADEGVAELTVPAYGGLGMKPDGVHLLLTDLTRELQEGEKISVTIKTADGIAMSVSAEVRTE